MNSDNGVVFFPFGGRQYLLKSFDPSTSPEDIRANLEALINYQCKEQELCKLMEFFLLNGDNENDFRQTIIRATRLPFTNKGYKLSVDTNHGSSCSVPTSWNIVGRTEVMECLGSSPFVVCTVLACEGKKDNK